MRIARYDSQRDNVPRAEDLTWGQLVELLAGPPRRSNRCSSSPCADRTCPGKAGPAWSPVEIVGTRSNANVRSVTVAVFDVDKASTDVVLGMEDRLIERGLAYVMHSTHSHAPPEKWCLRVALRLSRPVKPAEWPKVRAAAIRELELPADPATGDLARIYYLPDSPIGIADPVTEAREGADLDVDALLRRPAAPAVYTPSPEAEVEVPTDLGELAELLRKHCSPSNRPILARVLRGEPLAKLGEQDVSLQRLMSTAAFCLPNATPDDAVLHLFEPSFAATDWKEGLEHLKREALKKLHRARERKIARDAQRAEASRAISELLGIRTGGGEAAPVADEGEDDPAAWTAELLRKDGSRVGDSADPVDELKNNESNVALILKHTLQLKFNDVSKQLELHNPPPGISSTSPEGLDIELTAWLQRSPWAKKGINPRPGMIADVLRLLVRSCAYDPLREWLEGLSWDGQSRVDSFFERYFGASVDVPEYVKAISRRWLISAVSRGLDPGAKVDTVLILEGRQGLKKSTAVEVLFAPFFCDSKIDITNKDTWQLAGQFWGIELAELEALQGKQRETVKAFFSRRTDTYRPPYGKTNTTTPRRSIFVATTNGDEYLGLDPTGYRRFWPIACRSIDIEALKRDREQLFAEAVALYRAGEQHWLTDDEAELARVATREREEMPNEVWQETIRQWFMQRPTERRPETITTKTALVDIVGIELPRVTKANEMEVAAVLRAMGFEHSRRGQYRVRVWVTPEHVLNAAPSLKVV